MAQSHDHPYYPTSLLLDNFVPNEQDVGSVVTSFIGMWLAILVPTWYLSAFVSPHLNKTDKSIMMWFVLCGTLHVFFEGYYVLKHATLSGEQFLFAQLWKEYSLSDSRYLSGDTTVLCEEAVTVLIWGPLSYLTAFLISTTSPYRHPFQIMVSLAHLYGDLLYISTSLLDLYQRDISYSRPEPLYFWFYFLFLNGIWLVVPTVLLYQSTTAIAEAFQGWEDVRKIYQENRKVDRPGVNIQGAPQGVEYSKWATSER